MKRTYTNEINDSLIEKEILIKGWVKTRRKLGNLLFLDIRDTFNYVQVVFDSENSNFKKALKLTKESTVCIKGILKVRKNINDKILTGKYEIIASELEIFSIAEQTPMIIDVNTDALEEVRFKNRFLDLRRENIASIFKFRSLLTNEISNFLINKDFINIETPILSKPTPEGSADYLVNFEKEKDHYYALPQSPQLFKQFLMFSGFEKYFQIARCFRNENLRKDRQPEFTQLDIEVAFSSEEEVQNLTEELIKHLFKKLKNVDIKLPLQRMDFDYAMDNYGVDKPDIRFEMLLTDIQNIFKNTKANIFKNKTIKALYLEDNFCDSKQIKYLEKIAKDNQAKGLAWLQLKDNKVSGSISKLLSEEEINNVFKFKNLKNGTVFIVADEKDIVNQSLGGVRNELGSMFELTDPNEFKFLWIVNWPLFEYSEEDKRYKAAHHPFTKPSEEFENNFNEHLETARSRSYDIVLNGLELGGGSVRIDNYEQQVKMFEAVGLSKNEYEDKFGFLLDAFKYGVPPHCGIALGIDRLIQIMLDLNGIKECIAFPKNNNAKDTLFKSPSLIK